jgi:hypothetical protein
MSQVIVVNDLSNLGEQLKAALAGSGIDASQFGDIGVQIQKALADAGLGPQMVSGAVEAPAVEEPVFGELLDTEDDAFEFVATYSVKDAASIELVFNDNGDLEATFVSKNGDENSDTIDCSELDSGRVTASVEDDVLTVSFPKIQFPNAGDAVSVINFNPDADEIGDEDESDEDTDDFCDCEGCTAEREGNY